MNLAILIAPWLEAALNAYLRLDSDTARRLHAIAGRLIALEIAGPEITLLVRVLNERVQVSGHRAFAPDAVIRGSPFQLARLGLRADAVGPIGAEGVEIRGDAEVGRVFRDVLASVEIDWEEWLARRLGDIPAHQIGNAVRAVTGGLQEAADRLRMDVSEYLQEETRIMPTRFEVDEFMDLVDQLRVDVDRLEARIDRLAEPASRPKPGSERET